jgi:AcrR family transcriptional regulator
MTRFQDSTAARDRIIHAAIALFSRRGYYRTGTREIARLADISEVTLFRYFEHKEDIFVAALHSCHHSLESRLTVFNRSVDDRSPEKAVPNIVRLLVDITTFSPELLKLVAVAVLELRGKYDDVCCNLLAPLFNSIAGYLRRNVESGKVRNLNPAIVTAAMALTIVAQPELSRFIEGCGLSSMNDRETLEEFSSFWIKVLIAPRHGDVVKQALAAEATTG